MMRDNMKTIHDAWWSLYDEPDAWYLMNMVWKHSDMMWTVEESDILCVHGFNGVWIIIFIIENGHVHDNSDVKLVHMWV